MRLKKVRTCIDLLFSKSKFSEFIKFCYKNLLNILMIELVYLIYLCLIQILKYLKAIGGTTFDICEIHTPLILIYLMQYLEENNLMH